MAATASEVAGLGIIATSMWGCEPELESGQLVRLLPDWARDSTIILVMQTMENRMHMKLGRNGYQSDRAEGLALPGLKWLPMIL